MPKKSKGIGRGGARPGAGRKPNAAKVVPPPEEAQSIAPEAEKLDLTAEFRDGALKAIARLNGIIQHSSPGDAIKAAALLFTWGFVSPAHAKAAAAAEAIQKREPKPPELGKKEQQQAAAERVGGKFAPPAAPKLVVNNKP